MQNSPLIPIGQIDKPHGFRGSFVVRTDSGSESALGYLKEIYLDGESEPLRISEASWMPKGWKVTVESLKSDEDVRRVKGRKLFARREDLAELPPGEFYLADLADCEAIDEETGEILGVFKTLENGSPYDHWWFIGDEREFSIPGLSRFIAKVDTDAKLIRIRNFTIPETH